MAAAVPGGLGRLRADARVDGAAAAGLLAGAIGVGVMAVVVAAAHKVVVRPMQSDRLATIAVAGLVLLAAPLAAAIAIALFRPVVRLVVPRLPRPASTGTTGLLLLAATAIGVLGAIAAFSRADWRVLDLSPFVAAGIAGVAGVAHGIFWYGTATGRRLGPRLPGQLISHLGIAAVFVALVVGARLAGDSPAFRAADEGALGLRLGLRLARAATDSDGDGFSALFGGGDCDGHRADVYPGAEDIPGDGIDQNCEGGDAKAEAADGDDGEAGGPEGTPDGEKTGATGALAGGEGSVAGAGGAAASATGKAGAGAKAGDGKAWQGNLLMITIDAFRGDRLGVAGYRRAGKSLTPNLDALAARGAYFKNARSQAPNTPRSFPSILTSRVPIADRVRQARGQLPAGPAVEPYVLRGSARRRPDADRHLLALLFHARPGHQQILQGMVERWRRNHR